MSNKRTIRKVAMTRKGQVWLSAEGVDAAITAYKRAIERDRGTDSVIRESVCLADFAREVGRKAAAVDAYREALALCPKDSRDFMDLIDLMDFTDYKKVITSGPVLKRRSRMLRFGVKGKRSAKVWW